MEYDQAVRMLVRHIAVEHSTAQPNVAALPETDSLAEHEIEVGQDILDKRDTFNQKVNVTDAHQEPINNKEKFEHDFSEYLNWVPQKSTLFQLEQVKTKATVDATDKTVNKKGISEKYPRGNPVHQPFPTTFPSAQHLDREAEVKNDGVYKSNTKYSVRKPMLTTAGQTVQRFYHSLQTKAIETMLYQFIAGLADSMLRQEILKAEDMLVL